MAQIEKMIAKTFMDIATGLETGSFGARPKIAVTGLGSEHGEANSVEAAVLAADSNHITVNRCMVLTGC